VEAKAGLAFLRQALPVGTQRLQQLKGAVHVAVDESGGPLDRAVHMAFGRQVHHQVGVGLPPRPPGAGPQCW
jgi:hypothetical protein